MPKHIFKIKCQKCGNVEDVSGTPELFVDEGNPFGMEFPNWPCPKCKETFYVRLINHGKSFEVTYRTLVAEDGFKLLDDWCNGKLLFSGDGKIIRKEE